MKKYNYIVSVLMMVLSGYILFETGTYEIGQSAQKNPAIWPRFLAIGLIILSVALIIQTIFSHDPEMENFSIDWKGEGMRKVYVMFGLTVGFVIVLKVLGKLFALLLLNISLFYEIVNSSGLFGFSLLPELIWRNPFYFFKRVPKIIPV